LPAMKAQHRALQQPLLPIPKVQSPDNFHSLVSDFLHNLQGTSSCQHSTAPSTILRTTPSPIPKVQSPDTFRKRIFHSMTWTTQKQTFHSPLYRTSHTTSKEPLVASTVLRPPQFYEQPHPQSQKSKVQTLSQTEFFIP
jgi:hypothetical protein